MRLKSPTAAPRCAGRSRSARFTSSTPRVPSRMQSDGPLHAAPRFPPSHVLRIDAKAAGFFVASIQVLARAEAADRLAPTEAPGFDAYPPRSSIGSPLCRDLPVEQQRMPSSPTIKLPCRKSPCTTVCRALFGAFSAAHFRPHSIAGSRKFRQVHHLVVAGDHFGRVLLARNETFFKSMCGWRPESSRIAPSLACAPLQIDPHAEFSSPASRPRRIQ